MQAVLGLFAAAFVALLMLWQNAIERNRSIPDEPVTIAGNQGEVSGDYIRRQWVDAFIAKEGFDPFEMQYTNEIGFTFGTDPKIKLWFFAPHPYLLIA